VSASESAGPIRLGGYVTHWFQNTPRRTLHALSYYAFASRLIGPGKRVLDVGCNEGLGTWTLAVECGFARGIDFDADAIAVAQANWSEDPRIEFAVEDFLAGELTRWDAVVNFDVIEHIFPRNAADFLGGMAASLEADGVAIIGTPSEPGQRYASEVSRAGHVNVYSGERMEAELREHFEHAFIFAANDEMVHTGFFPMAHYIIGVGCKPRRPVSQSGA
jgi:2-polyprenyl-3-methyl-5-hydroxy-6-metoxy-1,4-benzoquinol methylase